MSPKRIAFVVLLIAAVVGAPALALDIYLNGVRITGVRNREFENATVSLDANGNVRIKAPQYRVERLDVSDNGPGGQTTTRTASPQGDTPPPTIAPQQPASRTTEDPPADGGQGLSKRYWLVAQVNGPGMVQYRVIVEINGRVVRTFSDADAPPPVEVTNYLRPGSNSVRIVAEKLNDGGRRSESSRHWMRIVVADGHIDGSAVVIDTPGVIFTRNAAQSDRATRTYTLSAD